MKAAGRQEPRQHRATKLSRSGGFFAIDLSIPGEDDQFYRFEAWFAIVMEVSLLYLVARFDIDVSVEKRAFCREACAMKCWESIG